MRNRPRLALTVAALAVTGAVLVGVLSTQQSLRKLVDQVAGYSGYDVEVAFTGAVSAESAEELATKHAGVNATESWFETQAFRIRPDGTENENISITAAPIDSVSLTPTIVDGRWLAAGDQRAIVINTHLAEEEPDLEIGAAVELDIEGHRTQWTVVGISTTTLVGPVAFASADQLTEVIGRAGETNLLAVELDDTVDPSQAAERIESGLRDAGLPVGEVQTSAELRAAVEELVTIGTVLLLLVVAVLAIVAVIGLTGTMMLSVFEQTREIGVLRAVGASNRAIRRLLLQQGLGVAALGAVVGAVLSAPVALLLRATVSSTLLSAPVPEAFSWIGIAIWFALAALIGSLGATRPARVAAKLTIKDTLAYE